MEKRLEGAHLRMRLQMHQLEHEDEINDLMIKLVQKTYRSEDWIVSCDAWRGSE